MNCKECGMEIAIIESTDDLVLGVCRITTCPLFDVVVTVKSSFEMEAEPKTPLEAVEHLEQFLVADFGAKDWSREYLRKHFAICKSQIKGMK